MREEVEESNWFARWEEELPRPEELMPLSQTLITPDLALAFDIPAPPPTDSISNNPTLPPCSSSLHHQNHHHHHHLPLPTHTDFDSADLGSSGGGGGSANNGGDEPARTLKRPRLVWTPQLHKRFVDAVAHLGIKNAVPKTIMQLMSVDGLTRENVASHLQKYRLYLKRMQGLTSSGGGAGGGPAGPISAADAATDQLFASGPIPHHFLSRGGGGGGGGGGGVVGPGPDPFLPYMPVAALQHHQQMAAAAAAAQQQYYHQRQMGHFGSPVAAVTGNGSGGGGGFDHGFLTTRPALLQPGGLNRLGPGSGVLGIMPPSPATAASASYVDDCEEGGRGGGGGGATPSGGRKVLTLFPTGDD